MRIIVSFIILSLSVTFGFAQNEITVVLKGQVFNHPGNEAQFLQQTSNPQNQIVIASIPLKEGGFFEEKITLKDKDYYIFKLEDDQAINIVVTGSDTIKIYGDGKSFFFNSNVINSPASTELLEFMRVQNQYKQKLDSAEKYLQANRNKQREIQQEFAPVHQQFVRERQEFVNTSKDSPALMAVIGGLNLDHEFDLYTQVVTSLKNSFGESPTVQRIVAEYEKNKKIVAAKTPVMYGDEALEIALPNPEGDTLRLSDYKGKVVLLDFWASWCGPCRRENPNVVRMYNKYNEKGFEVFSVSLDRTMDAWVKAIEQDGLIWKGHVSDLKFWQSVAAQAYKVHSIPYTILLDREGKVIGTNLRGSQLESTLESIFN